MPMSGTLEGVSATRQLARSLLYEVLGWPLPTLQPERDADTIQSKRWNKQLIYDAVLTWCEAHGRVPQWTEWRTASEHGLPSRATVQAYWGTCGTLMHAVRAGYRKRLRAQQ